MARVRIGSAEIDLKLLTGKFTAGVEVARKKTRDLKDRFGELRKELNTTSGQLRALGAIAGGAVVAREIFELGAAVEETGSKFATVFGDQAGGVQSAIDQFADLAGLSNRAAQEVTATTGAIVTGFGIVGDSAARMSVQVTSLAADLASFNNVPVAETARAIQAGLTGEMESLKRLGIAVLDVDVKQKALVMTGKALESELSREEIVMARLALITERAGVQVGDLQRTKDTAAASARQLSSDIENLRERIAAFLLPVIRLWVDGTRNLIQWVESLGADLAVLVARVELFGAALQFWDREGIQSARDNLERMRQAAELTKDEIAGFAQVVAAPGGTPSGAGTPSAAVALGEVTDRTIEWSATLPRVGLKVGEITTQVSALADQLGRAADEQSRLNSLQNKFAAVASLARFIPGAGPIVQGISTATSVISAVQGAQSAFGTQTATSGGGTGNITITLDVRDMSGRTTRVLRERLSKLDQLDVPVTV